MIDRSRLAIYRGLKALLFASGLYRVFLPVMKFDMTIAQLHFITSELGSLERVPGYVLEVGVGGGTTSVVLNRFIAGRRRFVAVDTFAGFLPSDISVEVADRGKSVNDYSGYRTNRRDWYLKTLAAHGIQGVTAIQSSIQDYTPPHGMAFCLLDVDLYAPTRDGLPKLYEALAPGGVIIVDDCDPSVNVFDGAGAAYREFCAERGLPTKVAETKLGMIRKPLV